MSSVKVEIGNKEFSLTGNEELIKQSAAELNETINEIENHMGKLGNETLLVLAALNIAEQKNLDKNKQKNNLSYISSELSKMADHLEEAFLEKD